MDSTQSVGVQLLDILNALQGLDRVQAYTLFSAMLIVKREIINITKFVLPDKYTINGKCAAMLLEELNNRQLYGQEYGEMRLLLLLFDCTKLKSEMGNEKNGAIFVKVVRQADELLDDLISRGFQPSKYTLATMIHINAYSSFFDCMAVVNKILSQFTLPLSSSAIDLLFKVLYFEMKANDISSSQKSSTNRTDIEQILKLADTYKVKVKTEHRRYLNLMREEFYNDLVINNDCKLVDNRNDTNRNTSLISVN
jgi:hypothetical protein